MSTLILLGNDDITRNTIMGGNIDVDRYLQDIKTAQNLYVKPILGESLYNKISDDYEADGLTGSYLVLYEDYVKEMIIHSATEIYLSHGAYMVSNNGITKLRTDSSDSISKEEVDYLVQASRKLFQMYETEFLKWIRNNPLDEYAQPCATRDRLMVGGWSLKRRGCRRF